MRRRKPTEQTVTFDLSPGAEADRGDERLVPVSAPPDSSQRPRRQTGRHRRRAALVSAAVVGAVVGGAATWGVLALRTASPVMTESAEVMALRQVERARLEALLTAEEDVTAFAEHLAEDFVLVDVAGDQMTKQQLVEALATGELDFRAYAPVAGVSARLRGPAGVVQHESTVEVLLAGVGAFRHPIVTTVVYEQQDGRWLAVREATTSVGPLPEPIPE
ncbi:nuclear transport factor 2 family protein [Oerskovia turbata]